VNLNMNTMHEPVYQFPSSDVDAIIDPNTRQVIRALQSAKVPVRIVGGAVRDILRHMPPRDVDLVANASPTMLIYLFQAHDWPVDVGGIQHGTVKVVFGSGDAEQKVDVSSLGYRIQRHGQEYRTQHTHSWEVDSGLRDLTINAMSMDTQGRVYDYQNGYADLQNQIIKLGPHAEDSLHLDPTGIMRYFRALSQFPKPKILQKDLDWIKSHVHLLADHADDKKVQMNMISILKSPHRSNALKIMCAMNINKYLPYAPCGDATS
jgi:tRNA nucleotidyltransferase/poly(A) polymerase